MTRLLDRIRFEFHFGQGIRTRRKARQARQQSAQQGITTQWKRRAAKAREVFS